MTVNALLSAAAQTLINAGVPDARANAEYLLAHVWSCSRSVLRLERERTILPEDETAYQRLIAERSERVPLQYILGYEMFMGYRFKTDPRVFIPRPETELLCERALDILADCPPPGHVLDLCAGTGAIGISIWLKMPDTVVSLCELSGDALANAKENAEALSASVRFYQGDLFAPLPGERYHLIVCNPPYIPTAECGTLQEEVLREPFTALCGGSDGLDFYRRLARETADHLYPGGMLLTEVGYNQAQSVSALLSGRFRDIRTFKDYSGHSRMVQAAIA
jgi:release factor glutamine methyltransferase